MPQKKYHSHEDRMFFEALGMFRDITENLSNIKRGPGGKPRLERMIDEELNRGKAPERPQREMSETQARNILGVGSAVTKENIKARYRFLVKQTHPDKFTDEKEKSQATEYVKLVTMAYKTLMERR